MSNTFTAQELADFYQKVADGGETEFNRGITIKDWRITDYGPSNGSVRQDWRIKPTQKVIDLSVLIDSQIDCEFKDKGAKNWHVSKACKGIYQDSLYGTELGEYFEQCQPRMNHKHARQGGECPLPEGFRVKVWWRNGGGDVGDAFNLRWSDEQRGSDIIAFEVLGVADDYVMPWEQDND